MLCLSLAAIFSASLTAPLFQNTGNLDSWDLLDYNGDARIEQVAVDDCPPGYGPEAIRLSGTVALLLAKGGHLQDGTYVALYRERAAATEDADGVILLGGAFGDDLSLEHNTKTMRPHLWLEQDNDTGFSFREDPADGSDRAIAEAVAKGLVTDPWNETGWIWQKVQVSGETLRAKYWPAQLPEPEAWALETEATLHGDRFGIRINSGVIDLAWFAAAPDEIAIPAPRNYLFLPRTTVDEGEPLSFTLYTWRDTATTTSLTWTIVREDGTAAASGVIERTLPVWAGTTQLVLDSTEAPAAAAATVIPLNTPLPRGRYHLRVSAGPDQSPESRAFQVEPESDVFATIRARATLLEALRTAPSPPAAVREITRVAERLLEHAKTQYAEGKRDEARATLRFVDETLAELHGPLGEALRTQEDLLDWSLLPTGYDATTGIGDAKDGKTDLYRPQSRLHFGPVECSAASFVMGHTYTLRVPVMVSDESPEADYSIHVAVRDPLGIRTVAEATVTPDPPTSQWQPGKTYWQTAELAIPRDDTMKQVSQPVVLDEFHDLLVSVRAPDTGAHVLLDNAPGTQPGRIGHMYSAGRFYISSSPIEIQALQIQPGTDNDIVTASVTNHDVPRSCTARLRYRAPSGHVLFEQAMKIDLDTGANTDLAFQVNRICRGEISADLTLWDETGKLADVLLDRPDDGQLAFVRENHVEFRTGPLHTPIAMQRNGWPEPVDVTIEAGGETLATFEGLKEDTTLRPPPHFGYYDITATSGDTTWHRRIVATVVETVKGQLVVNGEPFIVKGVNVHGMDGHSPARTRLMMQILKGLGFNSMRGDYPARWQVDMAHEEGLTYDILAPFSVSSTADIFARQDGPPLATARALTRQFIARYQDAAAALLWNTCNEITDENVPFLLAMYPLYAIHDPYARPVHYANLYGQDLWQGQDVMGVNYYFSDTQRAADRHPLIERSAAIAREYGLPMLYTEFNSYHGAVPTTGVEALKDLFTWGVEQGGMAGGYFYMMPDSDRHPGVFDNGYNTHAIMDEAFHRAFDDTEVTMAGRNGIDAFHAEIRNRRPFALRQLNLDLAVSGVPVKCPSVIDLAPGASITVIIPLPPEAPGPDYTVEGTLSLETHHGLSGHTPVRLFVSG